MLPTLLISLWLCFPSAGPPSAPLNLKNTSTTDTSVILSWSPPASNGGRTDIMYAVIYNVGPSSKTTIPVMSTTFEVTGLAPVTNYTFMVEARNGVSQFDPNTAQRTTSILVTTMRGR